MGLDFARIDDSDAVSLETLFSKEEVWVALFDLIGDQALGADPFISAFWQSNWDTVKDGVLNFLGSSMITGEF